MNSAPEPPDEIANKPPYLCTVIPRQAIALLYPIASSPEVGLPTDEPYRGRFGGEEFFCYANSVEGFDMLAYLQRVGGSADRRYQFKSDSVNKDLIDPVPAAMGRGWVEKERGSLGGWVYWQCGGQHVFSEVAYSTAPENKARNVKQDTLRLLEIAQQRFAEINKCKIRLPSASPSATETQVSR